MTSIDCGEYVDMGEHNKPLCKKSGYRPAECELCPTRVSSLEAENAKLREFARRAYSFSYNCYHGAFDQEVFFDLRDRMRDLGIEVDES